MRTDRRNILHSPPPYPTSGYSLDILPTPQDTILPLKGPGTRDTLSPRRQTNTSENFTFPQLRWRSVKMMKKIMLVVTELFNIAVNDLDWKKIFPL